MIEVSDQVTTLADWPANPTQLVPCEDPNPLPLIWTCVPGIPLVGETLFTTRLLTTNCDVLTVVVPTFTLKGAETAPAGTFATI